MLTAELKINRKSLPLCLVKVPENWGEIGKRKLKAIAGYLISNMPLEEARLWVFIKLTKVNRRMFFLCEPEDGYTLANTISFTNDKIKFRETKLRWIGLLRGPRDVLGNLTTNEYGYADTIFRKYVDSNDKKDLRLFVACLYRLPFFSFSKHTIEFWYLFTYLMRDRTLKAAMVNFIGMRACLPDLYPNLYPPEKQDEKPEKDAYGWQGIIMEVAGPKFGDMDKTGKTNLHTTLAYLDKITKQNHERIQNQRFQKLKNGK